VLKRPHYIAIGAVVLLTLVLLNLPGHTLARIKLAVGSLFLPLFGLANSADHVANKAGDAITTRSELLRQNESLTHTNHELQLLVMQAQETARENLRLRQLVGWEQTKPWKLKLGTIVLRDPANWWRTVQIDLGSREGIAPDMPVLTVQGLVGKVSVVSLTHSQVLLLGDSHCKVSSLIQGDARDRLTGIIGPSGTLDSTLVALNLLPPNANVKPGQAVVTSGVGGIFPPGIPLGTIVDAHPADYGLSTEARVKLAANLNALEEVWVIVKQ